MRPFQTVSQDFLLESLTEYYQRYRKMVEEGGDQYEFHACRNTLLTIVDELHIRGEKPHLTDTDLDRRDFNFTRTYENDPD